MSQFPVNPQRFDPYKNFQFKIKWDGRYVAGISHVSPLRRSTEVLRFRDGSNPSTSHKSPGRTEFDAIVLERGVTQDLAFEQWANLVWSGAQVSLAELRKDIVLDFFNEAGQLVLSYKIYRCWVSEYVALPALDANTSAIAIQRITLENEGWERDTSVVEPKEP